MGYVPDSMVTQYKVYMPTSYTTGDLILSAKDFKAKEIINQNYFNQLTYNNYV